MSLSGAFQETTVINENGTITFKSFDMSDINIPDDKKYIFLERNGDNLYNWGGEKLNLNELKEVKVGGCVRIKVAFKHEEYNTWENLYFIITDIQIVDDIVKFKGKGYDVYGPEHIEFVDSDCEYEFEGKHIIEIWWKEHNEYEDEENENEKYEENYEKMQEQSVMFVQNILDYENYVLLKREEDFLYNIIDDEIKLEELKEIKIGGCVRVKIQYKDDTWDYIYMKIVYVNEDCTKFKGTHVKAHMLNVIIDNYEFEFSDKQIFGIWYKDLSSEPSNIFHMCDICLSNNIEKETKYHCEVCGLFYLCEECYTTQKHEHEHEMVLIKQ